MRRIIVSESESVVLLFLGSCLKVEVRRDRVDENVFVRRLNRLMRLHTADEYIIDAFE